MTSELLTTLLSAIASRGKTSTVVLEGDKDIPHVRISGLTEAAALPHGMLQPLDRGTVELLRDGVKAEGRPLHYEKSFQDSIFPDDDEPFVRNDGIKSARAFAWGHLLLSSASFTIASYEDRLFAAVDKMPQHMRYDGRYPADRVLMRGTFSPDSLQEWMGFGYVDGTNAQACIIGSRVSTEAKFLPSNGILGSELAVLVILLACKKIRVTPISVVLSFTNTHARVIQASVIDSSNGPEVHIKILYHEPLTPQGNKVWNKMLRWSFWNCEEDDHITVREKSGTAVEKSTDRPHRKTGTPHKKARA